MDGAALESHAIEVHLDRVLAKRGMTLTDLANRVGVTVVNLSILKNGRAKAVRFSTLTRICEALDCQPGDLITYRVPGADPPSQATEHAELKVHPCTE
ncbi:helix-turn-helix domain-containing protein [Streptomyces fimicarius]|uniref:helix-turn-helix domain-containing protein n=1 Tax=Streptomyces griseus TaxID=1911 RepID=UPI00367EE5B0